MKLLVATTHYLLSVKLFALPMTPIKIRGNSI